MFADMKNPEGDKQGGEDVYGIVKVAKQDSDAPNGWTDKEKVAPQFLVPKNEGHQKRQSGMGRKEQVIAWTDKRNIIGRIDINFMRRRRQVRQYEKKRPDHYKHRDAF